MTALSDAIEKQMKESCYPTVEESKTSILDFIKDIQENFDKYKWHSTIVNDDKIFSTQKSFYSFSNSVQGAINELNAQFCANWKEQGIEVATLHNAGSTVIVSIHSIVS